MGVEVQNNWRTPGWENYAVLPPLQLFFLTTEKAGLIGSSPNSLGNKKKALGFEVASAAPRRDNW